MSAPGEATAVMRAALAGGRAWLVGGTVRDRLLGRPGGDFDLVVEGDVRAAARRLARAARATAFPLSHEHGAWRVLAREGGWHADLSPLRGGCLEADLALRDLTVNALAEPLSGGARVDPHGGAEDLRARRLRAVGLRSFADDPLRTLRLVRLAGELGFAIDPGTAQLARAAAPSLAAVAPERVLGELRRLLATDDPVRGVLLADEVGVLAASLPELVELRGVQQNRFHHLDVFGHTLEVLAAAATLERDPAAVLGDEHAEAVRALLAEPLADEHTRGTALRWGALLHDVAKPLTQGRARDGRVIFPGHDVEGARLCHAILGRLRASVRLRTHVAALAEHHLRLGFLVHARPLPRRAVYAYLRACEPREVDVTLVSVADRLGTRGDRAPEAIARHLELARTMLGEALRWRAHGPPAPLVHGDRLAAALGLPAGPAVGELLEEIAAARFAGEVDDAEGAIELARARPIRVAFPPS